MKILQILPSLQMGGVERGTIEIARALKEAGIPNAVASAGGPMVELLEKLGVPHFTLPLTSKNPFTLRKNAKLLADLAKKEGVTLMHARSRAPAQSTSWASQTSGIPWISTFHGVYGTNPGILKIPYNRIMLKAMRIICVSDYVMRHVIETYGADPAKLVRIHRGAEALARKLDDILDLSAERRAQVQAAALASVRANFSVEKMCATTLALYRTLAP